MPTALTIAAIGVVTLLPDRSTNIPVEVCLLCGDRGLADAILNVLLFVPLGAVLDSRGVSWRKILLAGFATSASIELLQVIIPGRNPSFGDLVFNTLGAVAGGPVLHVLKAWQRDVAGNGSRRTAAILVGFALAAVAIGALLLRPDFPRRTYYGQWTPEFQNADHYTGKVLSAEIAGLRIRSNKVAQSDRLRTALQSGETLRVEATTGEPPQREAPVFNIYDDRAREIISVGVQQHDVVVRYRTRARRLLLDQPTMRIAGVLRDYEQGQPWSAELRNLDRTLCLNVVGRVSCPAGYTAARSWALLLSPRLPAWLERLLDFAWLMFLFFPAGTYLVRRSEWLLFSAGSLAGLAAVSAVPYLLPIRNGDLFGSVAGLAAGMLLGAAYRRRSAKGI